MVLVIQDVLMTSHEDQKDQCKKSKHSEHRNVTSDKLADNMLRDPAHSCDVDVDCDDDVKKKV